MQEYIKAFKSKEKLKNFNTLYELRDYGKDNWECALITYKQENFNSPYSELQRTYVIDSSCKYFDSTKISTSLFGNCLDEKDLGVRLDLYSWTVEKVYIVK